MATIIFVLLSIIIVFLFQNAENPTGGGVDVIDSNTSDYLRDHLSSTYDKYEPTKESLLSRGIDRLFGEVTKGFQESEYMLGMQIIMAS